MLRRATRAVAVLLFAGASLGGAPGAQTVDTGSFDLYLLGRRIGRETYELRHEGSGLLFSDSFAYSDRGGEVALQTTLALGDDLTPRSLRASGRTYRFLRVDVDVEVTDGVATVGNMGDTARVPLPASFFTVPGYAPLAARALLIEYWEQHGRPVPLTSVPGAPRNHVFIESRGRDTISLAGEEVGLRRYVVSGVAWGREVVWLDEDGRLAAIFTRANMLPLDGVRDDIAAARPRLEALAVDEYMYQLQRLSEGVEPAASGAFALVGARLIDAAAGRVVEDGVLVVRDRRISAAGPRTTTPVPDDVVVLDASGMSVIPGLWDMHAHAAQIEWAPAYLAAGVTTVRDMGGGFAFLTAFRDTLASGRGLGPRLLLAGLVDGAHENAFGAITAATPQEGRAVVERYHAAGFQQVKLYTYLQPEVVRAITVRAHELGMTVTGHIPRALSLPEALQAGMDQVAHLPLRGDPSSLQAEEIIESLRDHGAAVDPTVSWGELLGRSQETPIADFQPGIVAAPWPIAAAYDSVRNEATPEAVADRLRASLAGVRALHDAGIPILAGTDYGVPAHSLHRELELYVLAGMSSLEALRAATSTPAATMGSSHEFGAIAPGRRADLAVVAGNPLADISAIRDTRWVVADGVMHACDSLWQLAGFDPPR